MEESIPLLVNNHDHAVITEPTRSLLEVLREELHLMGTKFGCGEAQCGACSVLVDGKRVFSCRTSVKAVAGKAITTIEGLSDGEKLHPVQQAFLDEGAYQCGYCIAGMIMAAVALLQDKPRPTEEEIVAGMNKNLCRCCGYPKIVNAIKRASGQVVAGGRP
jgi:aerobic-type carbon monoxide dehydrogenase small subunit (CoxS/CutS family)